MNPSIEFVLVRSTESADRIKRFCQVRSAVFDFRFVPVCFALAASWLVACSEPVDEARFSADEKRAELRRLVIDPEVLAPGEELPLREPAHPAPEGAGPDAVEDLLPLLDSSLAAGDDEMAMDYMLELEDHGGEVAVTGLGMVIDHALDEDLRLEAIAALSMMEDENIGAPLLRALDDPSEEVQIAALEVMADEAMVNLLPVLRLRGTRGNTEQVAEALDDAIVELEYLRGIEQNR